jgi:hypothetical protein
MEVALTCRARPDLIYPHIDPSATGGGKTSPKSEVRSSKPEWLEWGGVRTEQRNNTFQPGMCMKTNESVRNPRSEVRSPKPEWLEWGGVRTEQGNNTFQAGMCMKTNESVRSLKSKGFCGSYADSDSWLLTPDSCSSKNEGASGDVDENKGSGKRDTGIRDTKRADFGMCSPRNAGPRGAGRA